MDYLCPVNFDNPGTYFESSDAVITENSSCEGIASHIVVLLISILF